MKSAKLTYHESFPETPVSGRAGAKWIGWVKQTNISGQRMRPKSVQHPFLSQRKLWCLLEVHFDGVDLRFAMPQELDHFIDVLSRNPLPSGRSLAPECPVGRPNKHWLSRLPAKAKPWKFRQRLCSYLMDCPETAKLREFYRSEPIQFDFPGVFNSFLEAHKAM
ncbi:hypothetical protein [Aliiroseovarius sp.]|uniref:hypothetical protein n=1 Tax=Aliiroseovarius sp. TaxID=1872442 RepID=UPI003BAAC967